MKKKLATEFASGLAIYVVGTALLNGASSFLSNRKKNKLIAETAVTDPEIASFLQNIKDGAFVSTTIKVQ